MPRDRELETAKEYTVLLPAVNTEVGAQLLPLAEALITKRHGRIIIVGMVQVPEGHSLSEGALPARRCREGLLQVAAESEESRLEVKARVRVSHRPWDDIVRLISGEKVSLVLLPWDGTSDADSRLLGAPLADILESPPCDVALVRWRGLDGCRRILLPVRGGAYAALALEIGLALAEDFDAHITLTYVTSETRRSVDEEWFAAFIPVLHGLARVSRSVTVTGTVVESILAEAENHQLIVMGTVGRVPREMPVGPIVGSVVSQATQTVIVVKTRREITEPSRLPPVALLGVEKPAVEIPISALVDKWFAENTFHSHEFADLERLVELKQEQGITISLGLPTLNEETTIGTIIETIKGELMERYPLLDEMVLIDSGSTDYTVEIARRQGIPVCFERDVLPRCGALQGKGEALWKSLYVLEGDIIVWIDTDIRNIHPRFVYGLIGPLLMRKGIQYVKGFYRRPLQEGGKLKAGGGGRVTELTARPLLNLFYPELSGLVQPLAGEYAGRRQALERLPFFTGYGVETGLLIDMLENFGLRAIAQVDLEQRIHRNQPLRSLSKMSFAIIQVVMQRLEGHHKLRLLEDINKTMKLIRYEPRRFYLEVEQIGDRERPPMITIPEYRQKRGLPPLEEEGDADCILPDPAR
jgi:nucleotide-binding universal stress UspA family protein